jgi:hypothetical protein
MGQVMIVDAINTTLGLGMFVFAAGVATGLGIQVIEQLIKMGRQR